MIINPADRTLSVKEYYFSLKNNEIARINASRPGNPIINLGIGSPDGAPSREAVEAMVDCARKATTHGYQSYIGIPELRHAIAGWYSRWYGVELDPASEIQPLTGSKEGILLLSLTFLNKGDKVLVPNPGYPTYTSATRMCEAEVVNYNLLEDGGWYPDFDQLESMDLTGVKLMWVNYPNMPTGMCLTGWFPLQAATEYSLSTTTLTVSSSMSPSPYWPSPAPGSAAWNLIPCPRATIWLAGV